MEQVKISSEYISWRNNLSGIDHNLYTSISEGCVPDEFILDSFEGKENLAQYVLGGITAINEKYPKYKDQIVVGTFNDEIELELKENYPDLMRGAPTGTAAKFILTQYFFVNIFDDSDFACLQIPMSYELLGIEVELNRQTIIDRAPRRNIAVQYWTINDADEMRELIELGCDCIMTDDPILMKQILDEYR